MRQRQEPISGAARRADGAVLGEQAPTPKGNQGVDAPTGKKTQTLTWEETLTQALLSPYGGTNGVSLYVRLPGVVTWRRPRAIRGMVRYPAQYEQERTAWMLAVTRAVAAGPWEAPPSTKRLSVSVSVEAGGKYDLDRVVTAALDALQNGGAIKDDCLVDAIWGTRHKPDTGAPPHTYVSVTVIGTGFEPGAPDDKEAV